MQGVVIKHTRNIYEVEVTMGDKKDENGESTKCNIDCHLSGRLRKNYIRILVGDRVDVSVSPYDLTVGTITYRHRN